MLLTTLIATMLQVYASMWIKNPADTTLPGYKVIQAEGKTVRMVPTTEYSAPGDENHYSRLHHHGVALESKQMAYRIYFDRKQTIDVYCKRRSQMELSESNWYPSDELLARGYGDDILRVSGTVGVGALKPWDPAKKKMLHYEQVERRYQRIVEQGTKRGVMEMTDYGWTVESGTKAGTRVDSLTVRYTLLSGKREMLAEVFCSEDLDILCSGVQHIPAKGFAPDSETWSEETNTGLILGSWGTDWPVNDSVKYAKETVGLGVFIPREYLGEAVSDKQNELGTLRLHAIQTTEGKTLYYARYYLTVVGASKENRPIACNAQQWRKYLRKNLSKKK